MIDTRFVITTLVLVVILLEVQSIFLPKREDNMYIGREKVITDPKKRPFCNAFTGCGRKRSNLPPIPALSNNGLVARMQHRAPFNFGNDETIDSLLDLSAEPAVEDLSRQIMSEAKLWEAIQEANEELMRRKQEAAEEVGIGDIGPGDLGDMGVMASSSFDEDDEATPARSATASCAMPPCYI